MEVREAVEADADRLAELAGSPPDVMRNLVHDRTVRVLVDGDEDGGDADDGSGDDDADDGSGDDDADADERVRGFVSFDARAGVVHVTQIAGDADACDRLLEEPVRFARGEGMSVELLVPDDETAVRAAAEDSGFEASGSGPQFDGRPTTRYRLEPGTPHQ